MFIKIIKSSNLNGTIVPYDKNVWHTLVYYDNLILCQDNIKMDNLMYYTDNDSRNSWTDKSTASGYSFFQINYKQ